MGKHTVNRIIIMHKGHLRKDCSGPRNTTTAGASRPCLGRSTQTAAKADRHKALWGAGADELMDLKTANLMAEHWAEGVSKGESVLNC